MDITKSNGFKIVRVNGTRTANAKLPQCPEVDYVVWHSVKRMALAAAEEFDAEISKIGGGYSFTVEA